MKDGKRPLFWKVYYPFEVELKIDDTDWHIDIKIQLNLMSQAMKEWGRTDVTKDYPYGRDWDIFMLGHCMEVPLFATHHSDFRDASIKAKNHISYILILVSSQ
jgi:hypothetical protein